jgi:hypothetical protein
VTLAYVGTKGTHLSTFYDVNRTFYGSASSNDKPYPLLGTVPVNDTSGDSIYHGLHAQVERHLTSGIQFTAAYTWSHAIDNTEAGFDNDYRYGKPRSAPTPISTFAIGLYSTLSTNCHSVAVAPSAMTGTRLPMRSWADGNSVPF